MNTISHTKPLLSNRLDLLGGFFEPVLNQFQIELERSANALFGPVDVLGQIEGVYVGLFAQAIRQIFPDDTVIQEFSVYDAKHMKGRADLWVQHEGQRILFEAKQRSYDGLVFKKDKIDWLYDTTLSQARQYVQWSNNMALSETHYTCALIFEWVRYEKHHHKVLSQEIPPVADFYSYYRGDKCGLMVYGKVEPTKP